jgi:SSS family solute:Na+ symporter
VVQVVVAAYLIISAGLTILAPTLMLTLISTAYYGFTQFLPAFLGVFFVQRFSAPGIAVGLVAGDITVLALYGSGVSTAGINLGLVALLVNFAVTLVVSSIVKGRSSLMPIAVTSASAPRRVRGSTT